MLRVLVAALFGNILVFNAAAVLLGDGDVSLLTIYKPSFVPGFIMYLGQNYVLVLVVTAVVAHDGILITCIIMAQVQFKLINNKLAKLFVKNQQYRKNDFDKSIKECVDHHNYLLEFVSYTNRTFSSTLLAYLAIVILAMCVEFYTVSKQISLEATLKALIYISAVLFQLVCFNCMPGQLLTNETEKTSEVAFYSNWEEVSSPSVMCAVKMIIHRTQKPVFISAGGILSINMGTGMATLKTIFSYYMFLRTVTEVVD
ncbi:unnamed protein product [Acanthoscelides obtectus]|nr:unnamed protein product [Acanthoscelides obtectus]CAK1674960.1 Odorant receptor 13a [Acanthoscelides obtectus]